MAIVTERPGGGLWEAGWLACSRPYAGLPATMSETKLKLLTFNCWCVRRWHVGSTDDSPAKNRGLKYVSKYRTERIAAIANVLASSDYDVVTLQELWVFADFELVRAAVSKRLPYSKFFYRYSPSICSAVERLTNVGNDVPF